jgi:beta-glucosidase
MILRQRRSLEKDNGVRRSASAASLSLLAVAIAACSSPDAPTPATPSAGSAAPNSSAIHSELWPRVEHPHFADEHGTEARVAKLLAAMSLEAKVGQVIQADILSVTPADVKQYRLGSILAGGNSGPGGRDLTPAPAWLELADAFYDASMAPRDGAPPIPLLWGIDAIHGNSNIIGATSAESCPSHGPPRRCRR